MAALRLGYWAVTLTRAAVALTAGLIITFVADHSPIIGFTVIGGFALASGVVLLASVVFAGFGGASPRMFAVQGAVLAVGGVIALLIRGGSAGQLLFFGCVVFGLTGILELTMGLIEKKNPAKNVWIFVGTLGTILAIVALVVPVDFIQRFTGPDGVHRSLTASVVFVGAFGAYAVIVGVYLAIAGLSQYWARTTLAAPAGRT